MTREGLERERYLAFVSMTRNGATTVEAMTYIDLMWPLTKGGDAADSKRTAGKK